MKKILLTALVISIISLNIAYSGLTNGGFETGDLTGWTTSGCSAYDFNAVVQSGVKYEGTYSVNFSNPDDPADKCGILQQSYNFSNALSLDAYLRMDDWGYACNFGDSSVEVRVCNNTNCKSTGNICQDLLSNSGTWRKHSLDLSDKPISSNKLQFYVNDPSSHWGADILYFDNITLEEVTTTTTTTTTTTLEEKQTAGKTIEDIGNGLGSLFSGMGVPIGIFLLLMAIGSMVGYVFSSISKSRF